MWYPSERHRKQERGGERSYPGPGKCSSLIRRVTNRAVQYTRNVFERFIRIALGREFAAKLVFQRKFNSRISSRVVAGLI